MLIVCPNCTTSYNIDPASLGATGRTVRCARCKTSWFAGGSDATVNDFVADVVAEAEAQSGGLSASSPATDDGFSHPGYDTDDEESSIGNGVIMPHDAPSIVPPLADTGDSTAETDEGFAARRERLAARRKTRRKSSKWTAVILVLLAFNVALVGARSEVVRYAPQTASLFAAIGLPVNLRHLDFRDIKIGKEEHDGVNVLSIAGTIVSQSSQPVAVPPLRFAIRNASGQEIYVWTTRPGRSILGPGQKLAFHSRLASPPAEASDLMVRFADAGEARTAQPR
jgi:predicted Zn finger-like uncharacterized protein